MKQLAVRSAEIADAGVLSVLATEVWLDTYAHEGISAAYAAHLHERYSLEAFQRSLQAAEEQTLLCEQAQFVLGYAELFSGQAVASPDYGTVELATLYVRRHHKRQGIGTRLLRRSLTWASEAGHAALFLTVHHANCNAIAFYEAQGFQKAGDWIFRFEGIEVPNLVMNIALEPAESASSAKQSLT